MDAKFRRIYRMLFLQKKFDLGIVFTVFHPSFCEFAMS